jgi:hypothetical protein
LATVNPLAHTVRITGVGATGGVALAEVYDRDGLSGDSRLSNLSVNATIDAGRALVTGFVVLGNAPKQVLIRAVGPSLAPLGVTGGMADPQLAVVPLGLSDSRPAAANDNWGNTAELRAAFASAGAFALSASGRDAAVLVRLPPGGYTVSVSDAAGGAGTVVVEVYDLDP